MKQNPTQLKGPGSPRDNGHEKELREKFNYHAIPDTNGGYQIMSSKKLSRNPKDWYLSICVALEPGTLEGVVWEFNHQTKEFFAGYYKQTFSSAVDVYNRTGVPTCYDHHPDNRLAVYEGMPKIGFFQDSRGLPNTLVLVMDQRREGAGYFCDVKVVITEDNIPVKHWTEPAENVCYLETR